MTYVMSQSCDGYAKDITTVDLFWVASGEQIHKLYGQMIHPVNWKTEVMYILSHLLQGP